MDEDKIMNDKIISCRFYQLNKLPVINRDASVACVHISTMLWMYYKAGNVNHAVYSANNVWSG